MPTTEQVGNVVNGVLSFCTFPSPSELQDHKCYICLNDTLGPNRTEKPTKLRCGHVLGMSCLMTWALMKLKAGCTDLPCPFCRESFSAVPATVVAPMRFQGLSDLEDSDSEDSDEWNPHLWVNSIQSWSPENRAEMSHRDICQIHRAEELWNIFCTAMLDFLDRKISDLEHSPSIAIMVFLYTHGPLVMDILSWGTVYNFHLARTRLGWRPERDEHLREQLREPYEHLLAHLQMMHVTDEKWRLFQAFQAPNPQLVSYRDRLEQCRVKLAGYAQAADDERNATR